MRWFLLLVACSLVPALAQPAKEIPVASARAAPADVCAGGTAEANLNIGGVRARLYNEGNLFWRGAGSHYEVPRGSGKNAVFSASLWIGGTVDGDLRFAGSVYGPWEFWPGPLDASGQTTAERCADLDRIWTVTTDDLDRYRQTGEATPDLAEWPIAWGAPFFVDFDGDGRQGTAEEITRSLDLGDPGYGTRVIDLAAGERPVVFGRQTAWWVMNDRGGEHRWSETEPLGVEVRVTAWTLGDPTDESLYTSTFYRYDVINRSEATIEDAQLAMYVDGDLGDFNDDFVHADSTRQMLVFYNGDAEDEGPNGYGIPPALGIDLLSGGYGAMYFTGGGTGPTVDPNGSQHAYQYMRSLWRDGLPLREGGDGYNTLGPIIRWAFPGSPPEYWSEYNVDGNGIANTPADRRAVVSGTPFALGPGERQSFDVGVLFAQGIDRFDSVDRLRAVSDEAQARYEDGRLFRQVETPPPPAEAPRLIAPADGASFEESGVTFSWATVAGATGYVLELDTLASFQGPQRYPTPRTTVDVPRDSFPNNTPRPTYWRVLAENASVLSPPSDIRTLTNILVRPTLTSITVVANASGPISPHPGALASQGFPTVDLDGDGQDDNPVAGVQQTNGTQWLFATGNSGAFDGSYASFLNRTLLNRTGGVNLSTYDFEVRFTGTSFAFRRFQDEEVVEIPFEIWNIGSGTPDDASDDYRLIPAILDYTYDGTVAGNTANTDGVYGFYAADSPVSPLDDDPVTDWIYWYNPIDTSPGQDGYLAYANGGTPELSQVGEEVIGRTTFVGWNFGVAPPYPADVPEPGTVFRITTLKRFNVTGEGPAEAPAGAGLQLAVGPNPASDVVSVWYGMPSSGEIQLAVYDVLGREVAVLAAGPLAAGEHVAPLETASLSAGVYVVVLASGVERTTRTITVIR